MDAALPKVRREHKPRGILYRVIRVALITAVSGFLLIAVLLFFLQDHLIYHPRRYESDFRSRLPKDLVELKFTTDQGNQSAFYLPPKSGQPNRMWIMFGGNGSSALGWLDLVQAYGEG